MTLPLLRQMIVLLVLSLVVLTIIGTYLIEHDARLQEAEKSYTAGETAATIAERKVDFNRALELYLSLEEAYHPHFGNGKLYYDIGNTYFQLEEYPRALLYYLKAKKLMPREGFVDRNIATTKEKLKGIAAPSENIVDKIITWDFVFSLPERLQIFFTFSLIACILLSCNLWQTNLWIKRYAIVFVALAAIMGINLGYTHYFTPIDAVVVETTNIRRDAGMQYASVGELPLAAGTVIEVLDMTHDGSWVKVLTPQGALGYIPQYTTRIID